MAAKGEGQVAAASETGPDMGKGKAGEAESAVKGLKMTSPLCYVDRESVRTIRQVEGLEQRNVALGAAV